MSSTFFHYCTMPMHRTCLEPLFVELRRRGWKEGVAGQPRDPPYRDGLGQSVGGDAVSQLLQPRLVKMLAVVVPSNHLSNLDLLHLPRPSHRFRSSLLHREAPCVLCRRPAAHEQNIPFPTVPVSLQSRHSGARSGSGSCLAAGPGANTWV
jgi:hypothetical protein